MSRSWDSSTTGPGWECHPDKKHSTLPLLLALACSRREAGAGRARQEWLSPRWREFGPTSCSHGWGCPGPTWLAVLGLPQEPAILQGRFWAHTPTAACPAPPFHLGPGPRGSASPSLTPRLHPQSPFHPPVPPVNGGGLAEKEGSGLPLTTIYKGATVRAVFRATCDPDTGTSSHLSIIKKLTCS